MAVLSVAKFFSFVATAKNNVNQLRLAIISDYPEENWIAMNLCAEMLLKHLQAEHSESFQTTQVCPKFRTRFGHIPSLGKKLSHNADRFLNRFIDYPHYLRFRVKDFDLFHICDHTYSQLVHVLPPERIGIFCHDIDAFRSLVEPEKDPRPDWYKAMSRRILHGFSQAAVIFYSTTEVRQQIEHYQLVDSCRLVHAPYGIATEFSLTPHSSNIGDLHILDPITSTPFILHVGSCIPRKRIDVLLEVFALLRKNHPNLRLVKVNGDWSQTQQEQIHRLDLRKAIAHLKGLERTTLAELYRRSSVVLLTSEMEGFGMPVIEALACGAIVVASDIPVLREVGGVAAVYCQVAHISAWANTVEQLLTDPSNAPALQIRLEQAQKYSWSAHARNIVRAYLPSNKS